MKRRTNGFTLLETLIVMAIFGIVLAGTSQMVVSMLTVQQQQGKIAETNIEGIIGLDLLRQDLGKAGYGLPWNGLATYTEPSGNALLNSLNDASNAPRGIVSANGQGLNGSDYLVIKAANVATNDACNKWTFLSPDGTTVAWTPTSENLNANKDWEIILTPGSLSTESNARSLVTTSAGVYSSQYGVAPQATLASGMTSTGVIYGIDSNSPVLTTLRRPFNRADYYVAAGALPQRCAPGTGILYKAVVNQNNDNLGVPMPLLDCVADMQVIFRYDPSGAGSLTTTKDILTNSALWTAKTIHDQVKEVRVYILAQEGQKDANYTYSGTACVGCDVTVGAGGAFGTPSFNFAGITDWQNYRWKVYTLVVKLDNLL